jgi:hypothetical protein
MSFFKCCEHPDREARYYTKVAGQTRAVCQECFSRIKRRRFMLKEKKRQKENQP